MTNFLPDVIRSIEPNNAEAIRQLVEVINRLVSQGERLSSVSDSEMILFVGRQKDIIVDIQLQFGSDIKQLFVTVFGKEYALSIEVNHMHEEFFAKDIEGFRRAAMNPSLRAKIEKAYPRYISLVKFNLPTLPGDLAKLVEILQFTTIDMALLEQTVAHDTQSGHYQRKMQAGRVKGRGLFQLLLGRH